VIRLPPFWDFAQRRLVVCCLTLQYGTDRLSWNVGNQSTLRKIKKCEDLGHRGSAPARNSAWQCECLSFYPYPSVACCWNGCSIQLLAQTVLRVAQCGHWTPYRSVRTVTALTSVSRAQIARYGNFLTVPCRGSQRLKIFGSVLIIHTSWLSILRLHIATGSYLNQWRWRGYRYLTNTRSAAVRLPGLRVRTSPRAWMCFCCVLSEVSATGRLLAQRSPTDCGVSECDLETSSMSRPWPTGRGGGCRAIKTLLTNNKCKRILINNTLKPTNALMLKLHF